MNHKTDYMIYYRTQDDYIDEVENENDAIFLLTISGDIVYSNDAAVGLFHFSSITELCQHTLKDIVPDDFAALLPPEITPEHITNNKYLERVSKRKDGVEFNSWVRTQNLKIGNTTYVESYVLKRTTSNYDIEVEKLKQREELVLCEQLAKRNRVIQSNVKRVTKNDIFRNTLLNKHANISESDLNISQLIYHNISSKEITAQLNLKDEQVYIARKRLRKAMNIKQGVSLRTYFSDLVKTSSI